mgnify:CR=1 FL=1
MPACHKVGVITALCNLPNIKHYLLHQTSGRSQFKIVNMDDLGERRDISYFDPLDSFSIQDIEDFPKLSCYLRNALKI